jgi:hypothetical protein
MDHLSKMFAEVLSKLIEEGWYPPIYYAAIGANGSVICGQFDANDQYGLESTTTAEHIVGQGLNLPMNIMFSYEEGEAVRVSIENPDEPIVYH